RRRHLIEQRLKDVVVAAVDKDDIDISMPQRACRGDTRKARADDDKALALLTGSLGSSERYVRPGLSQHPTHGLSPCTCATRGPSIAVGSDYLAATGALVLMKLGGRFSRKAESASLASAEVTRSMNSWLSLSIAALSWPIEGCLRSRLLANNA